MHAYFTESSDNFRHCLKALDKVVPVCIPLLGMTATAPPVLLQQMAEKLWPSRSLVSVVRAPTVLSNVKFVVLPVAGKAPSKRDALKKLLGLACKHFFDSNRVAKAVVFVNSIKDLSTCVETLPRCVSYSAKMTDSAREAALTTWSSHPEVQFMVASPALRAGMDVPNVQLIVFYGTPYGLCTFAHGAGQMGRSCQIALPY